MSRSKAPALPPKWWTIHLQVKDVPPDGEAYMDRDSIQNAVLASLQPPGVELHIVSIDPAPLAKERP